MTGILLIAVAFAWLIAVVVVTRWVARRFNSPTMKVVSWMILLPALMVAPLVDELIGKRQFEQLCKENSTIQVDRAKAVGKTVYLAKTADVEIKDKWVRIVLKPVRFVDVTTGEPVVSYSELMADGGWLVRTLIISEGRVPLTFGSTCMPKNRPGSVQTFQPFGINYIEPPTTQNGETK